MSYTIEESWAVIHESQRIMEEQARRKKLIVTARASATTSSPSISRRFYRYIQSKMEAGLTQAESVRELSTEQPRLVEAFREEANKVQKHSEKRKKEAAARVRSRNN